MNGIVTVRSVGWPVTASTHVAEIVDDHAGTEGVSIAALQFLSLWRLDLLASKPR
jgi:hypothetical protein